MSDLISREDAIAKFKKTCTSESIDKNGIKRGEIHTAMTYEGIIKIIEALPSAEPERKWIPVTEALPEEETEVLVTVRFDGIKDMKGNTYVEVAHQIDGEWSSYSDEYKVMRHRHHVLAWMPLPEPWRGDR